MVLLDEPRVFLQYGSASLVCGPGTDEFDLDAPWADESNGLCGAGVPGYLQLQVGTHTGWVPFRLELHKTAPALDPAWEEVVEVSFTALSPEASLTGLMGEPHEFTMPPGDYRVRFCIRGFEEADQVEDTPDSYLLQFWPGAPAPGRIVKQTGERAAYWHRARRTLTSRNNRTTSGPRPTSWIGRPASGGATGCRTSGCDARWSSASASLWTPCPGSTWTSSSRWPRPTTGFTVR
ncbi:hypothetical protein [Paractinoplanes maris]|uniref:hypothetical protein n=1 Tax=Paractinoplanes maris TaxID=1734446 RepID=UPI002020D7EB|nr:hypothetical protein [Actinoplanes maris]